MNWLASWFGEIYSNGKNATRNFFLTLSLFVLSVSGALAVFGATKPFLIIGIPFGFIFALLGFAAWRTK